MSRFILPGLAVFALLSFSVAAQDLKDIQAKQKIAAEKLTADVANALDRSRNFEKTDVTRAKSIVQITLAKVKDSTDLLDRERDSLVRQLETGAALVHSLCPRIGPAGVIDIVGPPRDGSTCEWHFIPPSSWLHRRELTETVGPWRESDRISLGVDCDYSRRT